MLKIFIDAGHGGSDPGAISNDRREKDDNLNLALKLGTILKSRGVDVRYSRDDDTFVSLPERANQANDWGADYFISLHRNSADSTATGVETFVYSNAPQNTYDFGVALNDAVVKSTGLMDRGVKKGYRDNPNADYAVNRLTKMPSALVEVGFITNLYDNKVFDENIYNIVNALSDAIIENANKNLKE